MLEMRDPDLQIIFLFYLDESSLHIYDCDLNCYDQLCDRFQMISKQQLVFLMIQLLSPKSSKEQWIIGVTIKITGKSGLKWISYLVSFQHLKSSANADKEDVYLSF